MRPLDPSRVLAARRRRGLVAIFDLDGTLAPIARTPQAARVPAPVRRALARLGRRADTVVGVVSGRRLSDVARLVGGRGLWLAGVHGGIRRGPDGIVRRCWSRNAEAHGRRLATMLRRLLADVPGVVVERKGPIVAVHVRNVRPAGRAGVYARVERLRPEGYTVQYGRHVMELHPPGAATKGEAVRWIAARAPQAAVLYVGDDTTDETAFAVLGRHDFPVAVAPASAARERRWGLPPTRARYALADPVAVGRLVVELATARAAASATRSRGRRRP